MRACNKPSVVAPDKKWWWGGTSAGKLRGEWPSGPASSISFTEVKHGCVRSETGWATFRMNDQTAHSAVLRNELGVPCLDAACIVGLN